MVGASSYGFLSPVIKLAYQSGFSDAQVTASQIIWGTILTWGILLFRPKDWTNPFRGPWLRLAFIGIFGLAMTTVVLNFALHYLPVSFSVVLLFQFTWITLVIESVIARKMPRPKQIGSVAVILAGTFLAVNMTAADLHNVQPVGILLGLASAVTYSAFIMMTGRLNTKMAPVMRSAVMLTAALPIAAFLAPVQSLVRPGMWPLMLWGILAGILGQVIPTICYNVGIPVIGGSLSAVLGSIELPVAVLASSLIVGEKVHAWQWFGIILIVAGIALAELKTGKKVIRNMQEESR